MSGQADLVEAFAARLADLLAAARRHLVAVPERGMLRLAEPNPRSEAWAWGVNVQITGADGSVDADPFGHAERVRLVMPPIPVPWSQYGHDPTLGTYADVMIRADELAFRHAERLAGELARCLDLVAEDVRTSLNVPDLVSDWPIEGSGLDGDREALAFHVVGLIADLATGKRPLSDTEAWYGWAWGASIDAERVRVMGPVPEAVAAWVAREPRTSSAPWRSLYGPWLVYRAERIARIERFALDANGEARRRARELVDVANPGATYFAAVTGVLASYTDDPLATDALNSDPLRGEYAGRLLAEARRVVATVFRDPPPSDEDAARESAEVPPALRALRVDVEFAAELDRGSLLGNTAAAMLVGAVERFSLVTSPQVPIPGTERAPAGSLYALWLEDKAGAPRWLWQLARELWLSVWKPALEEDRERIRRRGMYGGVSVLALAVNQAVTAVMDGGRTGELRGEQLIMFAPDNREVGRIELARIDIRIHARLVALLAEAPPAVDGLFTLALRRGFERWREMPRDGLGDGQLLIDGGKRGLSMLLGCSEKDADYALAWGQNLTLSDIDVRGLWIWHGTYQTAAPGRAAVGMLTIQQALLPGSEQAQTGKGRYFAPWTEEPPLPADRTQRRSALHFWRLLGVRMAEIAADGKLTGGRAVLPLSVVEHTAKQAGELRWEDRRDQWVAAGALDIDGDGWRYGPLYDAERRLLEGSQHVQQSAVKGGRKRAEAAERGRQGAFTSRKHIK